MGVEDNHGNILNVFVRLIGYLNLILSFESYQEDHDEYEKILDIINKWAMKYEKNRSLTFIDNSLLIDIYEKLDELQTKYMCNDKMGSESEYSDYVVNLFWDLRVIYKKNIENR